MELILLLHCLTLLHNVIRSCWIKSDDGAIAAFIVPIVVIILVHIIMQLICSITELRMLFTDQLCIFGYYIKSIVGKATKNNE